MLAVLKAATRASQKAGQMDTWSADRSGERLAGRTGVHLAVDLVEKRGTCLADCWAQMMADHWAALKAGCWVQYLVVRWDVCLVAHWGGWTADPKVLHLAGEKAYLRAEHWGDLTAARTAGCLDDMMAVRKGVHWVVHWGEWMAVRLVLRTAGSTEHHWVAARVVQKAAQRVVWTVCLKAGRWDVHWAVHWV